MIGKINMGIFNALLKFESEILSYVENTEGDILCCVKKNFGLVIVYITGLLQ